MSTRHIKVGSAVAALLVGVLVGSAQWPPPGTLVYDNTTTSLGYFYMPLAGYEFGDEINAAGSNGRMTLTGLELSLSTPATFSPINSLGVQKVGVLNIYALDGPTISTPAGNVATPGTLLFSGSQANQGVFALSAGGELVDFTSFNNVIVPSKFAFTVTFSGLEGTDSANMGLDLYNPPTTGSSANDFWVKEGTSPSDWALRQIQNGTVYANFYAQVWTTIPEPSTLSLLVLAGVGGLGWALIRRRS